MLKYSLGIDVSKKDLHVCLSVIDAGQQVKVKASKKVINQQQGFKELLLWLSKHRKEKDIPLVITMEATGVYYEAAALFLFKEQYDVAVVLPNKAKKYLQAMGFKTKNDKIDAIGLSRMGAEQCLELWKPMDEFFFTLRALTRHHQSIQELKTNINNQLHASETSIYSSKTVDRHLKKMIKAIDKQLVEIEQEIHEHIFRNAEVAEKVKHITAIKGVGVMTVATILGETNGFALFKSIPQLVSYAGYDVVENSSGNHNGKTRISKKGDSHLRRAMHLPAFNMVRYDIGNFKSFFERILARHNQKMKAYVAVQKKLLVLIYTLWKKNEVFSDPKTWHQNVSGDKEAELSFA